MLKPIILEGPDGAGKSTLRDRLAKDLRRTPVHTGGPTSGREDLEKRMRDMLTHDPSKVIFDRVSPISDSIYRQADGREQVMNVADQHEFLRQFGPVVIFCRLRSSAEMVEHISREEKEHKSGDYLRLVIERHQTITDLYDQTMNLLRRMHIPVITYNWKLDRYSDLLRTLSCVA